MLHRVALVVNFRTFWQKALAAFITAAANDLGASLGAHTGAKTVLALARPLGRLVSHVHSIKKVWFLKNGT